MGPFRILAVSGGGFRGLFAAEALRLMSQDVRGAVGDLFDLHAGTSIGGLIAAGLAVGRTPEQLRDAILEFGPGIFDDRVRPFGVPLPFRKANGAIGGLISSKYGRARLEAAILAVLGAASGMAVSDVPRPLLLVATCVTTRSCFLMSNMTRPDEVARLHARIALKDALLATSGAPGYFPAVDMPTRSLVDGGLVANAPDVTAICEVLRQRRATVDTLSVLSVGTASSDGAEVPREAGSRGLFRWLLGDLVPLVLEAQEKASVSQAEALLGERHLRVDARPSPAQAAVLALDRATPDAAATLLQLAEEAVARARPGMLRRWFPPQKTA